MSSPLIQVSVKAELDRAISRWAQIAGKQMPISVATALTRTAKLAKEEVERQMPSALDRPNPYTMRGFKLVPATKVKLSAEVTFRTTAGTGSQARDYLSPVVYGGARKLKAFERSLQRVGLLPNGFMAVPGSAAKLDAYGNMSRGQIVQLLSYFQAFSEQGHKANATQAKRDAMRRGTAKTRGTTYFVASRTRGSHLPEGIWQRISFGEAGSAVRPVVIFVSRAVYKRVLDVPGIADRSTRANFEAELAKAVEQYTKSAFPKQQITLF